MNYSLFQPIEKKREKKGVVALNTVQGEEGGRGPPTHSAVIWVDFLEEIQVFFLGFCLVLLGLLDLPDLSCSVSGFLLVFGLLLFVEEGGMATDRRTFEFLERKLKHNRFIEQPLSSSSHFSLAISL